MTLPSPSRHLAQVAREYPDAWHQVDEFRAARGARLPDWPAWCFLPLAGAYAVASTRPGAPGTDVARIGALAAWRATQGIYRFDPDLYAAVLATEARGAIPRDILHHLPEWCPYVETPGLACGSVPSPGFFVHLEHDANDGREELRFLVDLGDLGLVPLILHLDGADLGRAVDAALGESVVQARGPLSIPAGTSEWVQAETAPRLALVLYLCARNRDLRGPGGATEPAVPQPKATRRGGIRLFPPDRPVAWDVGARVGAELRAARVGTGEARGAAGERAGPRPHIRRAHWHTYHVGARAEPRPELRWIAPVLVAGGTEGLAPTVREVSEE